MKRTDDTPEPTCGQVYGSISRHGHPCARTAGHPFDDAHGHICRCEAEHFLQNHAPCNTNHRQDHP